MKVCDLVEMVKVVGLWKRMALCDGADVRMIYHVDLPKCKGLIELEIDLSGKQESQLTLTESTTLLPKNLIAMPTTEEIEELTELFLEKKDDWLEAASLFTFIESSIKRIYSEERLRQDNARLPACSRL